MNTKTSILRRAALTGVTALSAWLIPGTSANAATYTWTVAPGGTGVWTTSSDWSPSGGPPTTGDSIFYAQTGGSAAFLDLAGGRTLDSISRSGSTRWEMLNDTGAANSQLVVNSITIGTATNIIRNGAAGLDVTVGNVTLTGGTLGFGATDGTSPQMVHGLTVTGTTSISAGTLIANVSNASGNSYSLGHLTMSGGTVNLLSRPAASATSIANVNGLSGAGGFIQNAVTGSNNTSTLAISSTSNHSSSTVLRNSSVAAGGTLRLSKAGSGTQTLSGSNSYSGGTTISAGTLLITSTNGVGTGAVSISEGVLHVNALSGSGTITNAVTITDSDGSYVLERANGMAYSAYAASSDIAGGDDTTASLLGGTASTARTLATGFDASSSATNDQLRASDVFSLNGTGTDLFVLQLQIADVVATQYLGWLNGSNTWVNAVTGNSGSNNASGPQLDYAGSFAVFQGTYGTDLSLYQGAYGFDTTANTVWAVLNHNSDFAVIPEPQTVFLAAFSLGIVVLFGVKRRTLTKAA